MKILLILLGLILSLGTVGCGSVPEPRSDSLAQGGLDRLFVRLQNASDTEEAQSIESAIRTVWSTSGRASVDALMVQGFAALDRTRFDEAEELFSHVVGLAPDFVEGWHMRALTRYMTDNYAGAIQDLREVLMREPRHFGAMVGLGEILRELGRDEMALRVFEYALSVNPHLKEARAEISKIRGKLLGSAI